MTILEIDKVCDIFIILKAKAIAMKYLAFLFLPFFPGVWDSGITNACKYSIDEKPIVRIDDHMQGIWKMAEDTNYNNYLIIEKDGDFEYSITYMNRGGDNRGLEHGAFYFSEIGKAKFLVIGNWDENNRGYLFYKIDSVARGSWDVVLRLATDPALKEVKSREELRTLLTNNLNNPSFFGKELHFHKKFEFNSFR